MSDRAQGRGAALEAGSAALLAAALLAVLLLATAPARAQETWRFDLYNELMSPWCPGRTLNDCPSEQAEELRAWIADQEDAGRDRDEVKAQLYRNYGDILRSAPRARGWGLTAYVIPVVAFLAAGAILFVFLRRQVGPAGRPAPAPAAALDPELERLMDDELGSRGS